MTVLGLPLAMFLVFVATILAGSIGALHYLIVHRLMGRPFHRADGDGERCAGSAARDRIPPEPLHRGGDGG